MISHPKRELLDKLGLYDDQLHRAGSFLKQIAVTKGQTGNLNTAGGYLVPEDFANLILPLREYYGAFRKYAQRIPMRSDTTFVPRRTGGYTVSWEPEATAPTDSSAAFDQVGLVAKKLIALVKVSTELLEDSEPSLAAFVADEAAFLMAQEEDLAGFVGTGTSTHGGFVGVAGQVANFAGSKYTATGHSTIATISNADLGNLLGTAPAYAMKNGAWYANPYTIGFAFGALAAAAGGEFGTPDAMTFMGFPLHRTVALKGSGATTGDCVVLFGDLGQCAILGERRELKVDVSFHRYMDADQAVFRVTERVAINVHGINSATVAGPVVGMVLG